VKCDSHYCTCLGHFGWWDANRNDPISVTQPKVVVKVAKASTVVTVFRTVTGVIELTYANVIGIDAVYNATSFCQQLFEKIGKMPKGIYPNLMILSDCCRQLALQTLPASTILYLRCKVSDPRRIRRNNPALRRTNIGWKYSGRLSDNGRARMPRILRLKSF
jgi:hypothetical protein